jgi:hypothetical protein
VQKLDAEKKHGHSLIINSNQISHGITINGLPFFFLNFIFFFKFVAHATLLSTRFYQFLSLIIVYSFVPS